ncbi:hypothetical protein [Legionella tunisiensis]|uniref:hypothetical protein n=1 Tax=Legionella tunisiensis TaxID=1034944 RepID=UPI0038BDAC56
MNFYLSHRRNAKAAKRVLKKLFKLNFIIFHKLIYYHFRGFFTFENKELILEVDVELMDSNKQRICNILQC